MNEWQPIETAPKDGTDVLLFRDGIDIPVVAGWFDNGPEEGWRSYEKPLCSISGEATHWMPLPANPGETSNA